MRLIRKGASMEHDFQTATGKSPGEVIRDAAEFLSTPCIINPQKRIDLCTLLPELNMREQFAYALLSEALLQGWSMERASRFCRQICGAHLSQESLEQLLQAFESKQGALWSAYTRKYSNQFSLFDSSYWATALSLGIDCDDVESVLSYLRRFSVTLMEIAYMENNNPEKTYTWGYYESFRRMLDELMKPPAKAPLPVAVRAIGGTAGKREGAVYCLALGVDLENPDPKQSALNVDLDITLKDRNGDVITVIKDRIFSIPPASVYHYGVTRQIRGAAVATLSASAKASAYHPPKHPLPRLTLLSAKAEKNGQSTCLHGTMSLNLPLKQISAAIHYQFLSKDNKILGGGNFWCFEDVDKQEQIPLSTSIPVVINGGAKVVLSAAFDTGDVL